MSWRTMTNKAEEELRKFLGLEDTVSVIYLNRASAGIKIALDQFLKGWNTVLDYQWPTFDAIPRIASTMPFQVITESNRDDKSLKANSDFIYAPVALGGEPIKRLHFNLYPLLLYDCAQTCYKDMFKRIFFTEDQYAVLSFENSKPLGSAAGGGALICHKGHEEEIREKYVPGRYFFNPRGGQCMETMDALYWKARTGFAVKKRKEFMTLKSRLEKLGYTVHNKHTDPKAINIYTHVYIEGGPDESPPVLGTRIPEPYANNELWRYEL